MMGMCAPEWSRYLHDEAGVPDEPEDDQPRRRRARCSRRTGSELPLLPGAVGGGAAERPTPFPLALASSSNREVFEEVLDARRSRRLLQRHRLVGGGRARQAGAGRLPRGCPSARRRAGALHGGRGLARGHPLGEVGRDARRRDPERRATRRTRMRSSSPTLSSTRSTSSRSTCCAARADARRAVDRPCPQEPRLGARHRDVAERDGAQSKLRFRSSNLSTPVTCRHVPVPGTGTRPLRSRGCAQHAARAAVRRGRRRRGSLARSKGRSPRGTS